MNVKIGELHPQKINGEYSTRDDMKPRAIICPSMRMRAKVGAFSWELLKRLKKLFP